MTHGIWKLFFVTAIVLSLAAAPAVNADEVSGYIYNMIPKDSTIEIIDGDGDLFVIQGFPFNNLEAQLEELLDIKGFEFDEGDCLTVEYSVKPVCDDETINKWDSLTQFSQQCFDCDDAFVCDCAEVFCSDDEDGITIEPFITRNRAKPGVGQQGKGQGHVQGKPPVTVPGQNKR